MKYLDRHYLTAFGIMFTLMNSKFTTALVTYSFIELKIFTSQDSIPKNIL